MLVLAPEVFDRWEKLVDAEHAIGTGPFILQERDDVHALMVRNPDYYKPGRPYLDAVRMQVITDEQAAWSAFLAGQLDHVIIPGTEAKKFTADQQTAKKYFAEAVKAVNTFYLMMNTRKQPYDDARVLRAMRLLMDHQEAISAWAEVWFGSGTSYMLTHAMDEWDLTPQEYSQYLDWKQPKDEAAREANSLLNAAGFTAQNPLRIELLGTTQTDWNIAIPDLQQSMWRRLAPNVIQANIKLVDDATARTLETRGDWEVRAPTARASWFDPDQLLKAVFHSTGSQNFAKLNDSQLDGMIDRQRAIFDVPQRKTAIKDIVKRLIDIAPYASFASRDWPNAAKITVKDWAPEVGRVQGFQYENVWLDV
jgi:peptide/nickel transport system substrate-binding protein